MSLSFQNPATDAQIKKYLSPNYGREILNYLTYFLTVLLCVALVYMGIRYYLVDTIAISGYSMFPNYNNYSDPAKQDVIQIDLLSPRFGDYRRGEVVVLRAPITCDSNQSLVIKRVIGIPGDKIIFENGKVLVQGIETDNLAVILDESKYLSREIATFKNVVSLEDRFEEPILGKDEYFVMGDNRGKSKDSRYCGKIAKETILGRELFRLQPSEKRGFFNIPKYNIGN